MKETDAQTSMTKKAGPIRGKDSMKGQGSRQREPKMLMWEREATVKERERERERGFEIVVT